MAEANEKWALMSPIWRKYCGVSDEYRTMRDRWAFLSKEMGLALPNLQKKSTRDRDLTFDLLDGLVEYMDGFFGYVGLKRREPERIKKVLSRLDDIDIDAIKAVNAFFFTLSTYAGLIKHAYFQRTVSLGIPQLESSPPSSPERTMGNETFHIAADNVGKGYSDCINKTHAEWDGFITFSPAIGQEYFYGAFCKPTHELSLFHVSICEEQKYYLGSYLIMAHEFGHAAIASDSKYTRPPRWFIYLYRATIRETISFYQNRKNFKQCYRCSLCSETIPEMSNWQNELYRRFYLETFEDFVADIVAYEIGGLNTMNVLLDFAPGVNVCYVRAYGLLTYLWLRKEMSPGLIHLVNRLRATRRELKASRPRHVKYARCFDCWRQLGSVWGQTVYRFEGEVLQKALSRIVKSRFKEIYDVDEAKEIERKLVAGIPVCDVDPRLILNEYYGLLRANREPNYSSTMYSLVMNEHIKS